MKNGAVYFFLSLVVSNTMYGSNFHGFDDVRPTDDSRVKFIDLDSATRPIRKAIQADPTMKFEIGKPVNLNGELSCTFGFQLINGNKTLVSPSCEMLVGTKRFSFDGAQSLSLASRVNFFFPAKEPFDEQDFRDVRVDLKLQADDEKMTNAKAFVSLKEKREVALVCKTASGGDVWAFRVDLNDTIDAGSVTGFLNQKTGDKTIPVEIKDSAPASVSKQTSGASKVLNFKFNWSNASLVVTGRPNDILQNFDGTVKIGSDERKVLCALKTSD